MKSASRGLSLAAVIVSVVNMAAAIVHLMFAQSSRWLAIGVMIFALGLFPVALVLRCVLKKDDHFLWIGLICIATCAGLLFVSDTVAEILLKNQAAATVQNPEWVDMLMLYSVLSAFAAGGLTFTVALLDALNSISRSRTDKAPLGLSAKVFWTDIVIGSLCLIAFVARFGGEVPIAKLVCLLSLAGAWVVALVMSRVRSDLFDEMAQENYRHAKAKTLDILSIILLSCYGACLIAEAIFSNMFTVPHINAGLISDHLFQFSLLYFGLQNIIKGLIFRKLEAN